jgi:hypothetical protein
VFAGNIRPIGWQVPYATSGGPYVVMVDGKFGEMTELYAVVPMVFGQKEKSPVN